MAEAGCRPVEFAAKHPEDMGAISLLFCRDMAHRRSARQFPDHSVPRELIRNGLIAAGSAPGGANTHPWHFVVVFDQDTKRAIRVAAEGDERLSRSARDMSLGAVTGSWSGKDRQDGRQYCG